MSTCAGFGNEPYQIVGGDGSPYSQKLRAVFRYRRIPFLWVPAFQKNGGMVSGGMWSNDFPDLKAKVIPVLVRPDNSYANDSTPLIRELDSAHATRKVIPADNAMRFIADALEDFSDEWGTKVMFYGRFCTESDAKFGAEWQLWQNPLKDPSAAEAVDQTSMFFAKRQIGRRDLVGATDGEVMEKTLRTVCQALEKNIVHGMPFLLGKVPTNADFGLYGQMRQWINDPWPRNIVQEYPAAWAWVLRIEDLSGYDVPAGVVPEMTPAAREILAFASETYFPFLLANFSAIEERKKTGQKQRVKVAILGGSKVHEQPAFPYQHRCLKELQESYGNLNAQERKVVDQVVSAQSLGLVPRSNL